MLLDQRRPDDLGARAQILAPIDRADHRLSGARKVRLAPARGRCRGGPTDSGKRKLRALAHGRKADIDHLDRLLGRMVRVAMLVKRIERGADRAMVGALELRQRDRHRQREFLAEIAQVEMDLVLGLFAMP